MSYYEDPADITAEHCHQEHNGRRDMDCTSCDIRAELVHCAECGASFEDGRWFTAIGSTAPNGCDHENLLDDWSNEIRCEVIVPLIVLGVTVNNVRCGDPVTTPGRTACDFHYRWIVADECAKTYQRMVAAR